MRGPIKEKSKANKKEGTSTSKACASELEKLVEKLYLFGL